MTLFRTTNSKPKAFKAYNGAAQAAPTSATWTEITLDTIAFNYLGCVRVATSSLFTVPETAMYRILGMVATVANSQTFVAALTYNNSGAGTGHTFADGTVVESYTGATDSNGTGYPIHSMLGVFELAAGSNIGMEWYQATTGPQGGVGGRSMLTIERLQR